MIQLPNLTVIQERGNAFESEHPISAIVCRPDGTVVACTGPPMTTPWRSAAKPFQLLGSLSFLPQKTIAALEDRQLALGAASHSGQTFHVDNVRALLAQLGLTEDMLKCGVHWPGHAESAHSLAATGAHALAIHNNCSGKHTFMLAAAAQAGLDADYRPPEHGVQQRIHEVVCQFSGESHVPSVVDGCGVPSFVLPIHAMARAWAGLADAMASNEGLAGRVGWAMHHHPEWVSGSERIDAALAAAANEPITAKVGAQGIQCIAIPGRRLGVTLKVHTGVTEIRAAAVPAFLHRALPGLLPENALAQLNTMRNWVGREVGHRNAVWQD